MLTLPQLDPAPLPGRACYADDSDLGRVYVAPTALSVANTSADAPDFLLVRYRDSTGAVSGGVLRVGLQWNDLPVVEGRDVVPVPFDSLAYRLVRKMPNPDGTPASTAPWQQAIGGGSAVATLVVGLTAHDAQVAEQLLDGTDVFDVDVLGSFTGVAAGLPWLVTADGPTLVALLRPLLAAVDVTAAQVNAAFQSLPSVPSPFVWTARAGAPSDPHPEAIDEIAARSLGAVFVATPATDSAPTEPTYRLVDPPPATFAVDLLVPRTETLTTGASWSMADLGPALSDPARREALLPAVAVVDPFQPVDVVVLCNLAFDTRWLQAVQVDLGYTGPTGTPTQASLMFPTGGVVQRVTAVIPPGADGLDLTWQPHARLAAAIPGGWPQQLSGGRLRATAPVVVIDRHALGMDFVEVEADDGVFNLAASVTVSIGATVDGPALATATLTVAQPYAWVALVGIELDAPLHAITSAIGITAADEVQLDSSPIADRRVHIGAAAVACPAPDELRITLAASAAADFPVVTITVEGPSGQRTTNVLAAGATISVALLRESVFATRSYRYQLAVVERDSTGQTLPMATGPWVTSADLDLTVDPSEAFVP